jgi:arylsulfatase A-like enzyme
LITAHLGKWDHRFDEPDPSTLGYDVSDGATGNGEGNVGAKKRNGRMDKSALNSVTDPKLIFDLTSRARDFMEEQVEAGKPFFLQLSHYAVHLSVFYRQATYDEVLEWQKGEKHFIPSFAAMLKDLDDGVGLLRQHIRDLGIEDNTYIIFMSDNGGRPTQRLEDGEVRERVNFPLSAGKHSVYEGGIRVPFGVDILPTIADIVGSDLELGDIDGGSFKEVLYGRSDTVTRQRPFLVFHDKSGNPKSVEENADSETALLQGDFKLIKTWKDQTHQDMERRRSTFHRVVQHRDRQGRRAQPDQHHAREDCHPRKTA